MKIEKHNSIVEQHEQRISEVQNFTLFSDAFMNIVLRDTLACQHVLRILTGNTDLEVRTVKTQYIISNIVAHGAWLDVLAEDNEGTLYNIEIQRRDTVDHARRTRFYGAMVDCEYLEKGKTYEELPNVYVLYISETDVWNFGQTVYKVDKYFHGAETKYQDGMNIAYINAAMDD